MVTRRIFLTGATTAAVAILFQRKSSAQTPAPLRLVTTVPSDLIPEQNKALLNKQILGRTKLNGLTGTVFQEKSPSFLMRIFNKFLRHEENKQPFSISDNQPSEIQAFEFPRNKNIA